MPRTNSYIDRLRRERAKAVRLLMMQQGLTTEDVARESGASIGSVHQAIAGTGPLPTVIEWLGRRLGKPFVELWQTYGDPRARKSAA